MDYSDIKILIADDVKLNIMLVQKTLASQPYQILTAQNGQEALEIIKAERPHLLLIDIMMPLVDGYEIIRQVRAGEAGDPNAKIVVLSALNNANDRQKGLELGADDYVTKPILIPHMLETIKAQVDAILNK